MSICAFNLPRYTGVVPLTVPTTAASEVEHGEEANVLVVVSTGNLIFSYDSGTGRLSQCQKHHLRSRWSWRNCLRRRQCCLPDEEGKGWLVDSSASKSPSTSECQTGNAARRFQYSK